MDDLVKPGAYADDSISEDILARASAIIAMGKTGDRDAIKSLVEILENKREVEWLRAYAAIALGRLSGEEITPPLIDALQDDSMVVSRAAISALGDAGNEQVIPFLKGILEDHNREDLHAVTITVLGKIGGHEITQTLIQSLKSSNSQVRCCAALALSELRTEEAVLPFMKAMNDSNDCLRAIAASSLGLIGNKQATGLLIEALNDKAETVRIIAASSLGYLGDSRAIPPLKKALNEGSESVRKLAAVALSKLEKEEATKVGVQNSGN